MHRLIGWFQIGWSADYASEEVVPLHYFGRDLVAYRSSHGELTVFDGHCPHLGAHLGYGGRVEGDCIVCPFHGWKWDSDGANVDIPYSSKINRAKHLRKWPLGEQDGVVYIWHDPFGGPPAWDFPRVVPDGLKYFPIHPNASKRWASVRVHPQVSVENVADAAHFQSVHRASEPAHIARMTPHGPVLEVIFELKMGRDDRSTWLADRGGVIATLDSRAWGVGMMSTWFRGADNAINLVSTTPIDEEHSSMMSTVWVPTEDGETDEEMSQKVLARISEQFKQIERDIMIWERMIYVDRPPFAVEESRDFMALRRWSRQFYAAASTGKPELNGNGGVRT